MKGVIVVLPIAVVVPTYNSMAFLPTHVQAMREWAPLVEEVVIVDSHSRDGTWEYLAENVSGDNVHMVRHPPGLYESWNYGIQRIQAEYTYISTVGDVIESRGLKALHQSALLLDCDVVLSPPRLMSGNGNHNGEAWPIHHIIEICGISAPVNVPTAGVLFFATKYLPQALLGSSASNLFRTKALKDEPFPCDFGDIGDTAWGIANARSFSFGIHPEYVASFVLHPNPRPRDDFAIAQRSKRLFESARDQISDIVSESDCNQDPADPMIGIRDDIRVWLVAAERRSKFEFELSETRNRMLPWLLKPNAWQIRRLRNQARIEESVLSKRLLSVFRSVLQGS